ncbi:hypothetical protein AVEN_99977-1 [Araneus ventricosus]|uniref:Uncharacterized protein n=1 Tax=Araneus ventricosus TaxID=182803 RepID=A0A4Y2WF94_ARAVE|nr:hypothetical protein AVEN_99977-1 [Araneus ventricosus]
MNERPVAGSGFGNGSGNLSFLPINKSLPDVHAETGYPCILETTWKSSGQPLNWFFSSHDCYSDNRNNSISWFYSTPEGPLSSFDASVPDWGKGPNKVPSFLLLDPSICRNETIP